MFGSVRKAIFVAGCWLGLQTPQALAELNLLPSVTVDPNNHTVTLQQTALLNTPTDLAVIPGGSGRMLVTEAWSGNIYMLNPQGQVVGTPYHNMLNANSFPFVFNDVAYTTVAFHPGFADSASTGYGKFYTVEPERTTAGTPDFNPTFSSGNSHHGVLYEYTVADPLGSTIGSFIKREVMRVRESGPSHNVNDLLFDNNGLLYISLGDGAHSSTERQNAQLLGNIYGKILRIDPLKQQGALSANGQYSIPENNPFYNTSGAAKEIYAHGLRNPFRISVDNATSNLYIGDVGQDNVEEINVIPNIYGSSSGGQNFGWMTKEGSFLFPVSGSVPTIISGMTDPVLQYDHQDGASIVGGYVYRGAAIPELYGKYVFAELRGSRDPNEPIPDDVPRLFYGDLQTGEIFEFNFSALNDALPIRILSLGEDANHELYVLALDGIYKIQSVPEPTGIVLIISGVVTVATLLKRGGKRPFALMKSA